MTKPPVPAEEREDTQPILALRIAEALVFASAEPVSERDLAARLPAGSDIPTVMAELARHYAARGVNLAKVGYGWAFRTAGDLAAFVGCDAAPPKRLSRAALEVLAIIAYHQPVTRAEIEEVRGVETSKGTLDILLELGWVRMRGRRRTPGRPVTYGTTAQFLDQFGLMELRDLPDLAELKGAGLLSSKLPADFSMPLPPRDAETLSPDEDVLADIDLEELGFLAPVMGDE